jgi:hypothetical protein
MNGSDRQESNYEQGTTIFVGATPEERDEVFVSLGQLYILAEGGERTAKLALSAQGNGATLLPCIRTGGAAAGMYGLPLVKPMFIHEEQWEMLKSTQLPENTYAKMLAEIVQQFQSSHKPARTGREKDDPEMGYVEFMKRQAKGQNDHLDTKNTSREYAPNALSKWTHAYYKSRSKTSCREKDEGDMSGYRRWPMRGDETKVETEAAVLRGSGSPPGSPRGGGDDAGSGEVDMKNMSLGEIETLLTKLDNKKMILMMELKARGASNVVTDVFMQLDKNNDGVIDEEEFKSGRFGQKSSKF